ncbi:unnamed protein product, partial [Owenia fusiformis]
AEVNMSREESTGAILHSSDDNPMEDKHTGSTSGVEPKDDDNVAIENDVEHVEEVAQDAALQEPIHLAQKLLKDAATSQYATTLEEDAVGKLISASKDGSREADDILRDCLAKGRGITDTNIDEVKWCLTTSESDKAVRNAAKKLFKSISPFGQTEIYAHAFKDSIKKIHASRFEKKLLNSIVSPDVDEILTEDVFISKVYDKLKDIHVDLETKVDEDDPQSVAFDQANLRTKILQYPTKTAGAMVDYTLDTVSKQGSYWLRSMIPTNQIYMLTAFLLYSLMTFKAFMFILPLFTLAVGFTALVICSLQMMHSKKKLKDVQSWTKVLKKFNESLSDDVTEAEFAWHTMTPYWVFFPMLIVSVMSFSVASKVWVPCSEMCILSIVFSFWCFFALSETYDIMLILSMVLNFISTLPMFFHDFPRIPVLYHIVNVFTGSIFSFEVMNGIQLNVGIPSFIYVTIPIVFLLIAIQKSWQGTYRKLIPHLVFFFWWQLAALFFTFSTWSGLARASLGYVMLVVLMPVISIVLLLGGMYYAVKVLTLTGVLKIVTTLVMLAIPAALGLWSQGFFKIRGLTMDSKSKAVKFLLAGVAIFSFVPLMYVYTPAERHVHMDQTIKWQDYRNLCSSKAWERSNMADIQIKCLQFVDSKVEWTGTVKLVKVAAISNNVEHFFNSLPYTLSHWLKCVYGEEYPKCDADTMGATMYEYCKVRENQTSNCHVENLNYYTFEIWVTMPIENNITQDIILVAGNQYRAIIETLKEGSTIGFRARFQKDVGGLRPYLLVKHMECLDCMVSLNEAKPIVEEEVSISEQLRDGVIFTANFFTCPVLEYKIKTDQ